MVGSHLVVGLAAWAGAAALWPLPADPVTLGVVLLGAVLPDIDHPSSWIGRRLWFVSRPVAALAGHRGITHSTLAAVAALLTLRLAGSGGWAAPLAVGYLSHLAADLVTVGGIPLFWPVRRRISLEWFRSGSWAEVALTGALAAILILTHGVPR